MTFRIYTDFRAVAHILQDGGERKLALLSFKVLKRKLESAKKIAIDASQIQSTLISVCCMERYSQKMASRGSTPIVS